MTDTAQFSEQQFVNATGVGGLNNGFGTASGAIAAVASGLWALPGLLAPEAMGVSFSGLVATVTLPAPWALVTSGGSTVYAHGTVTNQDTSTYSVDFSSAVPASGSLTVYLLAQEAAAIQQGPVPIPGPPPGHPSYNPNFVPSVGYARSVQTVSLSASSGVADNLSTFELLRTTLAASATGVSSWTTSYQQRASSYRALPPAFLASGGILSVAQAQSMLAPSASGLTHTLPPASGSTGAVMSFFNANGGTDTISTAGTDRLFGASGAATASFTLQPSGAVSFYADGANGAWRMTSSSPNAFALGGILTGQLPNPDIVTNPTLHGTLTVTGPILNSGSIHSSGTIVADGRLLAGTGAYGTGNTNIATILGDWQISPLVRGYRIMPDGFIIQWGNDVTTTGFGDVILFPLAFPTFCFAVIPSEAAGAGWNAGGVVTATTYGVANVSTTGFQAYGARMFNGGTVAWQGGLSFYWMAIGR